MFSILVQLPTIGMKRRKEKKRTSIGSFKKDNTATSRSLKLCNLNHLIIIMSLN
jgi:hypothetical protein